MRRHQIAIFVRLLAALGAREPFCPYSAGKKHVVSSRSSSRPGAPGTTARAILLGGVCLLTAGHPAVAREPQTARTFSLSQTIAAALKSSADLQTAVRVAEMDRKRADAQFALLRPAVALQGSATAFDQKTQASLAGLSLSLLNDHHEAVSLGVAQDLDLFGQIRSAASEQKLQSLADRQIVAAARLQRILAAKVVYYSLLRAEHQVRVAEAALATARQQQAVATKLNANQVGQKIDVLRANTQVAASVQDRIRAQDELDQARNNFADLVGIPLGPEVRAEDVPGANVGVDVSANRVGAPSTLGDLFAADVDDVTRSDLDQTVAAAERRRPEVLSAEILRRAARVGVKLAHAGLDPTFAITAATSYYPTPSFTYVRRAVSEVTFGVSVPLYDGGATHARVQEARLQVENTETMLDRRRKDVALEVRQARLSLLTAAHQVQAANTALRQAVAARQLAQARYEGQVGLYLEVTDAQAALVQAESGQVDTVYGYLIARAQYEKALGLPTER